MADSLADPVVFRNTTEKEYVELSRQRTQTMFDGSVLRTRIYAPVSLTSVFRRNEIQVDRPLNICCQWNGRHQR